MPFAGIRGAQVLIETIVNAALSYSVITFKGHIMNVAVHTSLQAVGIRVKLAAAHPQ
jgi:hypothetical protein